MSQVKFYLKNSQARTETPIQAIFNYENHRLKMATGLTIQPKYWSKKDQRSRQLMEFPEGNKINEKLEEWSRVILDVNRQFIEVGQIPDAASFKEAVFSSGESIQQKRTPLTFWGMYDRFVDVKRKEAVKDLVGYNRTLRKHLVATEKLYGRSLTINALKTKEGGFVEFFDDYMMNTALNAQGEPGFTLNTIGKQHKCLKTFLNWLFDNDYYPRFSLKHLPTHMEDIEAVYLNEEEVKRLEDLEIKDSKEKAVRDLFLIACETGLRYSDFSRIKKEMIVDAQLRVNPKKGQGLNRTQRLIIPVSDRFTSILEQYNYELPTFPGYRVSEFNKLIRKCCHAAEINSPRVILKRQKGKVTEIIKPKYEMVSSHTGRRTFCTLKFLKGMPSVAIMKFSGHKTERSFMKYLKLDMEVAAEKFKNFF